MFLQNYKIKFSLRGSFIVELLKMQTIDVSIIFKLFTIQDKVYGGKIFSVDDDDDVHDDVKIIACFSNWGLYSNIQDS